MSKKKNKRSISFGKSPQKKLDKIMELWDKDPIEALTQVEELAIANPKFEEAWEVYSQIATEQEFLPAAFHAHFHLLQLDREDEERIHNFALLCGALAMPFSALYYASQYHEIIGDSMIDRLNDMIETFEPLATEIRKENPDIADLATQYLSDMEVAEKLLSISLYKESRDICLALKAALPDNPTPRNNLAMISTLEGEYDDAYTMQRETLELFPDNYHTRCNFAQLLVRMGRNEEAQAIYAPMRADKSKRVEVWLKRFETLAMMGNDAELAAHYQSPEIEDLNTLPYALHMIATAHARIGDEETARNIWRKAKREDASFELAKENLINLDLLVGDKQDAWYFEFEHWVPEAWFLQIEACFNKPDTKKRVEKLLQSIPHLQSVLPILLDQGELTGRELALDILGVCPSPIVLDLIKKNRGREQERVTAAYIAYKNNYLPHDQPIKMQIQGIVQELHLFQYDVFTGFVDHGLSKHIQKLVNKIHTLIDEDHDYETALDVIKYARSIDANERSLMNFHSLTLTELGRKAEAKAIILETIEKHPDYIFPQIDMVREQIREGDYDTARQTLDKWSHHPRFHSSEFLAYVASNIELLIAQKKYAKAKCWLYQAQAMIPYAKEKFDQYHGIIAFNSIPKDAIRSLMDAFSGD